MGGGDAGIFTDAAAGIGEETWIEGFLALAEISCCFVDTSDGDPEVQVAFESLVDEVLQDRIGEELTPGDIRDRRGVGDGGIAIEAVAGDVFRAVIGFRDFAGGDGEGGQ